VDTALLLSVYTLERSRVYDPYSLHELVAMMSNIDCFNHIDIGLLIFCAVAFIGVKRGIMCNATNQSLNAALQKQRMKAKYFAHIELIDSTA